MSERIKFLDGFKAVTLRDVGSFVGRAFRMEQLASHGDHIPSWLEPPAETGAEALLAREQGYLADANLEVRTAANSVIN